MLTSILTPVVHGSPAGSRLSWWRLAVLYSVGTVVSATAAGIVFAAVAWGLRRTGLEPWHWAHLGALAIALAYIPRQLGWTRFPPLLQSTRQVPREWAYDYPRWGTALLFGLGLGSGLYTRIVAPTFYMLLIWPFLTPGFLPSVLIWSTYGLARSGNLWWLALTAPPEDPMRRAGKINSTLVRRVKSLRSANAAVLIMVAAWLMVGRYSG